MRITNIKRQVKRADRYSVYIDGKYTFSLGEPELLNLGLRPDQEVGPAELAALKDTAKLDKAYDRALNLIARRVRSEWELRDYLGRKGLEPEVIGVVVERLRERGYVNDPDFARRWVANRRLLKATSRRRLRQELKAKRVSDEVIGQILSEDETDETQVLRDLVAKKRRQSKYQDNLKLMQYLSRQGYNYDDIKTAIDDVNTI